MPKQPTGLKRGLPASVEPEPSEIPKKHKQEARISPPPHPPPTHHERTPLKPNGQLPSPMTRDETSPPYSELPTPALEQFASPGAHESNPSQPVSGSQTQPFSQIIFPSHSLAYEVDDEEKEGVWGYLIPVDGKTSKYGTLIMKERLGCSKEEADTMKAKEKQVVSKDEYKSQEHEVEKNKQDEPPSQGYLLGRHPECGMYLDYLLNIKC